MPEIIQFEVAQALRESMSSSLGGAVPHRQYWTY